MQAILVADYSFTPLEYWRGVSLTAREFIRRCLTIDPGARMTAHEALSHPWIADAAVKQGGEDLLPTVKKNFSARRTLHAAIDTIRAINQLRAGGAAGLMDGALSRDPARGAGQQQQQQGQGQGQGQGYGNGDRPQPQPQPQSGDAMEIDSRGHGAGQTEAMIREQERKIRQTAQGMWERR